MSNTSYLETKCRNKINQEKSNLPCLFHLVALSKESTQKSRSLLIFFVNITMPDNYNFINNPIYNDSYFRCFIFVYVIIYFL